MLEQQLNVSLNLASKIERSGVKSEATNGQDEVISIDDSDDEEIPLITLAANTDGGVIVGYGDSSTGQNRSGRNMVAAQNTSCMQNSIVR